MKKIVAYNKVGTIDRVVVCTQGHKPCERFISQLLNGPDLIKSVKVENYSAAQIIQYESSTIHQPDFKY